MEDNSTKYLSELQAGDHVQVYNSQTQTCRGVAVGRLKQEVRPCVLVELLQSSQDDQKTASAQVFLQQAETVRLGQEGGGCFVRVTDLVAQTDGEDVWGQFLHRRGCRYNGCGVLKHI